METIYRTVNDRYSQDAYEGTLEELQAGFDQLAEMNPGEWNVKLRVLPGGDTVVDDNTDEVVARSLEAIAEMDAE